MKYPGGYAGYENVLGGTPTPEPVLSDVGKALEIISMLVNTNINYQERLTILSDRVTRLEVAPPHE